MNLKVRVMVMVVRFWTCLKLVRALLGYSLVIHNLVLNLAQSNK